MMFILSLMVLAKMAFVTAGSFPVSDCCSGTTSYICCVGATSRTLSLQGLSWQPMQALSQPPCSPADGVQPSWLQAGLGISRGSRHHECCWPCRPFNNGPAMLMSALLSWLQASTGRGGGRHQCRPPGVLAPLLRSAEGGCRHAGSLHTQ